MIEKIKTESIDDLVDQNETRKMERGIIHTPREIRQQGAVYQASAALLRERKEALSSFLKEAGLGGESPVRVFLSGAGSSFYVGESAYRFLQKQWGGTVRAVASTELVTHPELAGKGKWLLVHFARSGDSPESLGAYLKTREANPGGYHLIITCNPQGALARKGRDAPRTLVFLLPPPANDRSLVMTSSFSSLLLTALALPFLEEPEPFFLAADLCGRQLERLFSPGVSRRVNQLAQGDFKRVCILASASLEGMIREGALKIQELTASRVVAFSSSFLELRHGHQVFVDRDCLVFAHISGDNYVRQYELDMLRELRKKKQGRKIIAVCHRKDEAEAAAVAEEVFVLEDWDIPEDFRVLVDLGIEQQFAMFAALARGLKPDNPSPDGTINRVVQGVRIY